MGSCSSEGVRAAGVPLAGFGPEYASTVCAELETCCAQPAAGGDAGTSDADAGSAGSAGSAGDDDCEARIEAMIERTFDDDDVHIYHADIAADCIDARLAAAGCGRFAPSSVCDGVVDGPLLDPAMLDTRGVPLALCAP